MLVWPFGATAAIAANALAVADASVGRVEPLPAAGSARVVITDDRYAFSFASASCVCRESRAADFAPGMAATVSRVVRSVCWVRSAALSAVWVLRPCRVWRLLDSVRLALMSGAIALRS